jgi:hypothetical protein
MEHVMRSVKAVLSGLVLSTSVLLTACGGGASVEIGGEFVDEPPFDVIMLVNTRPVVGVQVFPGEAQTVNLPIGQSFELAASGPVEWTTIVGGNVIAGQGNTIFYAGAQISQTLTTNARYAATTGSSGFLAAPVVVTVLATSTIDRGAQAKINIVLTN